MLINCGIKKIWVSENYPDEFSKNMLAEAGVEVIHLPHGADEACPVSGEPRSEKSAAAGEEKEGGKA